MRVDATEVRVQSPSDIGVVADRTNAWLLPPHGPPGTVEVARNAVMTATLSRSDTGSITYTSRHWALGERVDTTALLDDRGRAAWIAPPSASDRLRSAIAEGGEVRLHAIRYVRASGPFGTCNGTLFEACVDDPAVPLSLATDARDIAEMTVVRTPVRSLGIAEVVFGAAALGVGAVDGAVALPRDSSAGRSAALAVGAGVLILGGLAVGNGIWRLFTPEQRFVYRAPGAPPTP